MDTKARETNFYKDIEDFGPIGEQDLIDILSKSPKTTMVKNVTEDTDSQKDDIDIVQLNKDGKAILYEVKTDTRGISTRNIAYEVFSNGNIGCLIRSKAHYIYYVFIDENKKIKERFLIDRLKLNKWIMQNFGLINRTDFLKSTFMTKKSGDKTALLLINIDKLCTIKLINNDKTTIAQKITL